MVKLKTVATALGSLKDLKSVRTEFDSPDRRLDDETVFPPEDVRPGASGARTLGLRVRQDAGAPSAQGDVFALVHVPAATDFVGILALNPSTRIESGATFAELVDEGGWPVLVAIAEDVLGIRVDNVIDLTASAVAEVVADLGPLPVYSRTAFSAEGVEFAEGTNRLDGSTTGVFASADPVDDAGQTRTRNQRALLRGLVQGLTSAGLAKNPAKVTALLGHLARGVEHDAHLSTSELTTLARSLRGVGSEDYIAVTVPTVSQRHDDGRVTVDFDAEAVPALRQALAGGDTAELFRYLASLGY